MFCPSNETLQSLTEKTKLLAHKCTQQIRHNTVSGTNNIATGDGASTGTAAGQQQSTPVADPQRSAGKENGTSGKEERLGGMAGGTLRCFCPCKGTISKLMGRKLATASKEGQSQRTTKWYVKVIQMATRSGGPG
uniref:Uncharacterized protein n=1 Tax=Anopheles maculatus TaxID=74869 RepID=A0A182SKU6_9DIPT